MNLTILQPGRIGDIIICLPIAKHYHDLGYHIRWPIHTPYFNMFKDVTDYVEFIPCSALCNNVAKSFINNDDKVLSLGFGISGLDHINNEWLQQNDYSFDQYKYKLSDVPFEKKYQLDIKRNGQREKDLYDRLVTNENYVVVHEQASNHRVNIRVNETNYQKIVIGNQTDNVFDWITILHRAKNRYLIDSCYLNLCVQLGIGGGTAYRKPCNSRNICNPVLKEGWNWK